MNALLELAGRCEAATGPDRELDDAIWLAINEAGCGNPQGGWRYDVEAAPAFTASLDAAMTLCAADAVWDVTSTGTAWIMPEGLLPQVYGNAATPALALCAAALCAKQSTDAPRK